MGLVEGFSDEALLLLLGVIIISLISVYAWIRITSVDNVVHPDNRAAVAEAREHRAATDGSRPNRRAATAAVNENEQCPICLDQMIMPCETNCGHVFCGPCIIAYWETSSSIGVMKCPVCRQAVSLLLTSPLSEQEQASEEVRRTLGKIHAYNRRFSGEPRTLFEYIQDFPVLFRHLIRELFSVNGLVAMFRLRIFLYLSLALLYIVSPLDLIPEAVTGVIGFIDDLIILLVILVYVTVLYRNYVTEQ